MGVLNNKTRFATEGIRFQRHNPDGTIPTPQRFLGFANTVNLTKVLNNGKAPMTIKIDANPAETKIVDFSGAARFDRVSVTEAVEALNKAEFTDITFCQDLRTSMLKGAYASGGTPAKLSVRLTNNDPVAVTIDAGVYGLFYGGVSYQVSIPVDITLDEDEDTTLIFIASSIGKQEDLPAVNDPVDVTAITPAMPLLTGVFTDVVQGVNATSIANKIQVVSKLAGALNFGQSARFGGYGLEIISFFDDETINIGLPKDVKEKEEIDLEGAKGTITRMIIGAMLQGLSPVVALKKKDYHLLEMIQGGILDRENGIYEPPRSNESEQPTFYAEIFSGLYGAGSSKMGDTVGYERILLRSMSGIEGDVPIDAKAWATYAFNLTATEYTDENGNSFSAWQEQTLSLAQFDALRLKEFRIAA